MYLHSKIFRIIIISSLVFTVNGFKSKAHNKKFTSHASISFFAQNTETKKILKNINSDLSLTPASTLKLITTATILELYGPNHKFKTIISYDGTIDVSGTLNGNIYIEAGNDPCLNSSLFEDNYNNLISNWASKIITLGIKKVNGSIIADTNANRFALKPDSWPWSDLNKYYGTEPSTLSFCDNTISVGLKIKKGHPIIVNDTYPKIPESLILLNKIKLNNRDSFNINTYFEDKKIIINGCIPQIKKTISIKIPMENPPFWVASSLHNCLSQNGVMITEKPKVVYLKDKIEEVPRVQIYKTSSPPLIEIIKQTNKKSINSYAEQLLAQICFYYTGNYDHPDKNKMINWFWKKRGINTSGIFIHDGSGLSRHNAIDTKSFVEILNYMLNKSIHKDQFINALGQKGVYGSFGKNYFHNNDLNNRLWAKAGGLKRINSFAGYLKNKEDQYIAFAIIIQNHVASRTQINKEIENKLMDLLTFNELN